MLNEFVPPMCMYLQFALTKKIDKSPTTKLIELSSNNCNMASDNDEPKVLGEEDKRLKRKQSLEASVHLGLGYGKKKKQHLEAFYSAVWPVLEGAGWTLVS